MKHSLIVFSALALGAAAYFGGTRTCALPFDFEVGQGTGATSTVSTAPQPNVPDGWITDINAAIEQAKTENKQVLVKFTGSDWCPPCTMLQRRVLDSDDFKAYADENLVQVYVDFPRFKPQTDVLQRQNKALHSIFQVEGFPTMVVLGKDGTPLAKMMYTGAPTEEYIGALKEISEADQNS
ncbi:MAG: thioredoxin family protein [Verrucomicrobiota bacterium]